MALSWLEFTIRSSINKIEFNDLYIKHICKPSIKHSYISVGEDGITLKTPRVSKLYIENLLKEKESWIYRKLREFQSRVYIDKEIENEAAAKAYLADKIDHFSQKMGLNYSKLKFRKMKRRWGSCSSVGVITLNTYLYNAPEFQIDYVVVHELAHLVYMDHSKEFHSLVASHIPQAQDYKSFVKRFYLL